MTRIDLRRLARRAHGRTFAPLFVAASVLACSNGEPASASPREDDATTPDTAPTADARPADDTGAPDAAAPDATTPLDAAPVDCSGPVGEASLCLGRASGRAGERVSIPIHVLLPDGCTSTTQVHATLVPSAPVGQFVAHAIEPPTSCWNVEHGSDGGRFMYLSASAVPTCPSQLTAGELVRVELDIAAGTPPGEYEIALTDVTVGDNHAECRGEGSIGGRLTVLP